MRDDFETEFVDFFRPFRVFAIQLGPEGVIYPYVNVTAPMPLVLGRGNVGDGTLVNLLRKMNGEMKRWRKRRGMGEEEFSIRSKLVTEYDCRWGRRKMKISIETKTSF